ncbi:MAG: sulfite exporter TauE/SafE family protein [Aquabacterium sp.]
MESLSPWAWAAMAAAVTVGYTVFGLVGFGATLVATPVLALMLPLKVAIPLMLLFDLGATVALGLRNWRQVAWREWLRLVPCMLLGQFVGVGALVGLPTAPLLLGLGVFVIANALWSLFAPQAQGRASAWWALPTGLVGGTFGGLFGTGGPLYAIYLSRRLDGMSALRATTASLILVSAWLRLSLYIAAGLYADTRLLWLALSLAPACLAGAWVGSRLHGQWPPDVVRRALFIVLLVGGAAAIAKALA